jgi:hypothetical protein
VGSTDTKTSTTTKYTLPKNTNYKYEVLRQGEPYEEDTNNGLGLEILLKEKESDLTKKGIVKFINTIEKDKDPVNIRIFLSRKAYEDEQNENYSDEYDKGYLLFYVKNTTVDRAYYGFNEIRWMQEKGKFSNLFGNKTKLE